MSADADRTEWRVALNRGGHRYTTERGGGGVCVRCGDTVAPEEL